jgi:hypothetical protein
MNYAPIIKGWLSTKDPLGLKMSSMKFENKDVCSTFFENIRTEYDAKGRLITIFRCQCNLERRQDLKKGYGNLFQHIISKHPDYLDIMNAKHKENNAVMHQFVNTKATNIFNWLEFIIMKNLPFSFVEDKIVQKQSKYEKISIESLMKYLYSLKKAVENKVAAKLTEKFVIVFDGWTERSRHFIGLFAVCYNSKENKTEKFLLSIAPPFDEESFDANSHYSFIVDVLELFGKSLSNVVSVVGDNARVNKFIADLMNLPFIGCSSHRFNLACKLFLEKYETQLENINSLMKTLRKITKAGALRKKTDKEPVKRNITRWSSTYAMLKRFFEIKPFLDESDPDISCWLPSGIEFLTLQELLKHLENFNSVTKELQKEDLDMSEVRDLFDGVIEVYPMMGKYLARDAKIVHAKDFENRIVKIIEGNEKHLSLSEKEAVKVFELDKDNAISSGNHI